MDLQNGLIPMDDAELAELEQLMHDHEIVSLTRRDPGESGPVVVHLADGSEALIGGE